MDKKTVVLGASPKPDRYSYQAVSALISKGYDVVPLGIKDGMIDGIPIVTDLPPIEDVDTITLYLSAKNQTEYFDYIWSLNPRRIIFNPGAENMILAMEAKKHGIEVITGCTLVMLSLQTF